MGNIFEEIKNCKNVISKPLAYTLMEGKRDFEKKGWGEGRKQGVMEKVKGGLRIN